MDLPKLNLSQELIQKEL